MQKSLDKKSDVPLGLTTTTISGEAGRFRVHRLRDGWIDFKTFKSTPHYDLFYRLPRIDDRIWVVLPWVPTWSPTSSSTRSRPARVSPQRTRSSLASCSAVYSGDNGSGTAVQLYSQGTYAMDSGCGPVLGLGASNVLGFRPRFIQLADGYQVKLQGWHGNPGDTHCAGPSYSQVPITCTNSKNLYDAGCISSWAYDNVGGAVLVE